MSTNDNSSSLKAAYDQISGYAQSALGSLTGSSSDQAHGNAKQDQASAEKDLSHSVGKVGPFAVSGSGGVSQDNPDRSQGQWDQTVGSGKEMLGNLLGADGLKKEGQQQNLEGQGREAHGQLEDLGSGIKDRISGAAGSGFAGLTGNKADQERYQERHDAGKTLQRSAEQDINRN